MKERTLVYMLFKDDGVGIRTVSRSRKSPRRFYISQYKLEQLEHKSEVIAQDIYSFAVLCRDKSAGTVRIEFTWLENYGDEIAGYQDTVILPYDKMAECLQESIMENKPVSWKTLSIDNSIKQAKLVFKSGRNLHAALENGTIRRKFVRFLRDEFKWVHTEKIEIYDDFVPYSFFFREIRAGGTGICGGLILHGQEDMKNAYYSMHT